MRRGDVNLLELAASWSGAADLSGGDQLAV